MSKHDCKSCCYRFSETLGGMLCDNCVGSGGTSDNWKPDCDSCRYALFGGGCRDCRNGNMFKLRKG